MIMGYARVSTGDRNLDAQLDALGQASAGRVFADRIGGALRARLELERLLDQLRKGDVVVAAKYDRLARSLKDLLEIVDAIREHGVGFRSLAWRRTSTPPRPRAAWCSTSSPPSRSSSGSGSPSVCGKGWRPRASGAGWGRPPALSPAQEETRRMRYEERRPLSEIAALFKVSVKTVRRA